MSSGFSVPFSSPVGVPQGGTGLATVAAHDLLVGNGTGNLALIAPSAAAGLPLLSAGASADPAFGAPTQNVTMVDGATPALDASLVPPYVVGTFRLVAAGDRTIAVPTSPTAGQRIIIEHFASGAGRTLALNTGAGGFRFGSDITSLTQTASGKTDYVGCRYNGNDSKWDVIAVTKGF